jgi:hypothetical protein
VLCVCVCWCHYLLVCVRDGWGTQTQIMQCSKLKSRQSVSQPPNPSIANCRPVDSRRQPASQ